MRVLPLTITSCIPLTTLLFLFSYFILYFLYLSLLPGFSFHLYSFFYLSLGSLFLPFISVTLGIFFPLTHLSIPTYSTSFFYNSLCLASLLSSLSSSLLSLLTPRSLSINFLLPPSSPLSPVFFAFFPSVLQPSFYPLYFLPHFLAYSLFFLLFCALLFMLPSIFLKKKNNRNRMSRWGL